MMYPYVASKKTQIKFVELNWTKKEILITFFKYITVW